MPGRNATVQQAILAHLQDGGHLTLFLDYDGTLVPIAPTPAEAEPDKPLLRLLYKLAREPAIRTVILSGRPLDDLQHMLPVPGLLFAGLYGVEVQVGNERITREPMLHRGRKALTDLQAGWLNLISSRAGFLVEDKGRSLALHARWAEAEQSAAVLPAARRLAVELVGLEGYRILDGDRFIEVAPITADKGKTVAWLLDQFPMARDLPVGFGDDNKDEAAFDVLHGRGGWAVGVGYRYALPEVDARLESPAEMRAWLRSFLEAAQDRANPQTQRP